MFSKDFADSILKIVNAENVTTDTMLNAIDLWLEMYGGNAPWLKDDDKTLGIPGIVASDMARCVTLEMEVGIAGSPMADFIAEQLKPVLKNIRQNVEYACAGGGIVFKPCVNGDKVSIEIIKANNFYPVSFDSNHKITGAYFVYRHWEDKKIYTRLERHELDGTTYTVTNRVFVSTVEEVLGRECSLAEVSAWANIAPEVHIENIDTTLFSYFKIPLGNTTEIDSPLGVSVYARAVKNIRDADEQYQRLNWEYKAGEAAIDAAEDAFKRVNGVPLLPEGKERLFRVNALDSMTVGSSAMAAWMPSLRDANYIAGLNRILMTIEDLCFVSRGTLSFPTDTARTATEMKILKQRSYTAVSDIQMALEDALEDLIRAVYTLAILYELVPDGKYETSYTWDDSIITDADTEREVDRQDVRDGFMSKWEYRMKWYGEDEATAKRMVADEEPEEDEDPFGFNKSNKEDEETEEE